MPAIEEIVYQASKIYYKMIFKSHIFMRTNLLLTAVAIIALTISSCKNENQAGPNQGISGSSNAGDRTVLSIIPRDIVTYIEFPANIEGQQVIEIRPMISGYVKEIHVNEGDHVTKGQLLFRISNPQYEQAVLTAEASIASAQAAVNTAKMNLEKVKPLVDKEIVSNYELLTAELTLTEREAALAQAQASLVTAQTNLDYTYIKSPADGLIGTIPYKIGALVSSNISEPLTTMANIDNVYAYFSWNEKKLLDFLSETEGVTVDEKMKNMPPAILRLANGSEYAEKGVVNMASGLISTQTGTTILKATFANPTGILRSGSSGTIRIQEMHENVLVIPQKITSDIQDKHFVYVVQPDNTVKYTALTVTASSDGQFYIVNTGLNAGDRVVIEGITSLTEGATINPIAANADDVYQNIE